jgi:hypothetical protein
MNTLKTFTSALLFTIATSTGLFAASLTTAPVPANTPAAPIHNEQVIKEVPPVKAEQPASVTQKPEKKKSKFNIKDNIKGEQKTLDGGGIYISVGALIIILILLIIFL